MTWREPKDRMTCLRLNLTAEVVDGRSISKRLIMSLKIVKKSIRAEEVYELERETDFFWYSVKNLESRGVEGTRKRAVIPTRTVNKPSYESGLKIVTNWKKKIKKRTRMKIQAHPGLPPMPCMFTIAAESNPEKAPDSWVNLRGKISIDSALHNAPKMTTKKLRF